MYTPEHVGEGFTYPECFITVLAVGQTTLRAVLTMRNLPNNEGNDGSFYIAAVPPTDSAPSDTKIGPILNGSAVADLSVKTGLNESFAATVTLNDREYDYDNYQIDPAAATVECQEDWTPPYSGSSG